MYNYLKFLGAAMMMVTLFATTSCNRDKPRFAQENVADEEMGEEGDEGDEGAMEGMPGKATKAAAPAAPEAPSDSKM